MAKVFGIHEVELRPGVTAEKFEQFVRDEFANIAVQPVWKFYVLKGDRGARAGKFLLVMEIESAETRDRLFPDPGGEPSAEAQQHLASIAAVLEKWDSLATGPGEPGTIWTDYVELVAE